jgi:ankyrin repeat protein
MSSICLFIFLYLQLLLSRASIVEEILNASNSIGKTALHLACENESHIECARLLLEAGSDPLTSFDDSGFPIHYAVRSNSIE